MNTPFSRKLLVTAIAGAALIGCGGGGSSDSKDSSGGGDKKPGNEVVVERVSLTGLAVKGLLKNAPVVATSLADGSVLKNTQTDEQGRYNLSGIEHTGPILVTLTTDADTQAKCDAVLGCGNGVAFGDFYAFNGNDFELTAVLPSANLAADQPLMVTPITHLAAQRVVTAGDTDPARIEGTLRATAKLVGLEGVNINSQTPADVTDPEDMKDASSGEQKYGAVVAALANISGGEADKVADVIENLTDDYKTDGTLKNKEATAGDDVSLEELFENSESVLDKSEQVAKSANVELGSQFKQAQMEIQQKEQEAEQATEDETSAPVVDVQPQPQPVPDDIKEDNKPTEPAPVTKEQAVSKGLTLLEDLNNWHTALTDERNETLTTPFVDQTNATGELVGAVDDGSKLVSVVTEYLISENTRDVSCATDAPAPPPLPAEPPEEFDPNNSGVISEGEMSPPQANPSDEGVVPAVLAQTAAIECDSETEIDTGPVFDVINEAMSLATLAGFIREKAPEATNYSLDTAVQNGYRGAFAETNDSGVYAALGSLNVDVSDAQDKNNRKYTFTRQVIDDDEVINYTAEIQTEAMTAENKAVISVLSFNGSVTPAEGSDNEAFYLKKQENVDFGVVTLTFKDADALNAFLNKGENSDSDLIKATADFRSLISDNADLANADKTAQMTIDLDLTNTTNADDAAKRDVTLKGSVIVRADVKSTGESLVGTLTLNSINTAADDPAEEGTLLELANGNTSLSFNGTLLAKGKTEAGNDASINFDGTISATAEYFRNLASDKAYADNATATLNINKLHINEEVNGTTQLIKLEDAKVEATAGILRNPAGGVFKYAGEPVYMTKQLAVTGKLSVEKDGNSSAVVSINAVADVDVDKIAFNSVNLPAPGDEITKLNFNMSTVQRDGKTFYRLQPDVTKLRQDITARYATVLKGEPIGEGNLDQNWYIETAAQCSEEQEGGIKSCQITQAVQAVEYRLSPANQTIAERLEYIKANSAGPGETILSVEFARECMGAGENDDTLLYCPVNIVREKTFSKDDVESASTEQSVARAETKTAYENRYKYAFRFNYISVADGEIDYGISENDASVKVPEFIAGDATQYQAAVTLEDSYINFDIREFESVEAYTELSVALGVSAAVTGLDNAAVNIFAQRNGKETAAGNIRLSYGARTIDLSIDSLADISDVTKNNLTIKNQDTEMTIKIDCVNTDSTVSNAEDKGCSGDLRFQGEISVAGHKVGDIEDRNGVPVFAFDNNETRKLVVVPNFLVTQ